MRVCCMEIRPGRGGCTFNKFVITWRTKWRMEDMNVNIGRSERTLRNWSFLEALSWWKTLSCFDFSSP